MFVGGVRRQKAREHTEVSNLEVPGSSSSPELDQLDKEQGWHNITSFFRMCASRV